MTGFGKTVVELPSKKIVVEIKSLNSKQLDLSVRIPAPYRELEMEIRSLTAQRLERGKVELSIYTDKGSKGNPCGISTAAMESYRRQILEAAKELDIDPPTDWFPLLLRLPDVMQTEPNEADEAEQKAVLEGVQKAIDQFQQFRLQEGAMLDRLFREKIANIALLLKETASYEKERIDKIKNRIGEALNKLDTGDYDKNRFEQEMIYYIEKLDVNEEKNRLDNHLRYFIETLDKGAGQGKKLGFIAQEMGREINTLGSKSNHAEMQRIVVQMKDELEQIKEQVLNVL